MAPWAKGTVPWFFRRGSFVGLYEHLHPAQAYRAPHLFAGFRSPKKCTLSDL